MDKLLICIKENTNSKIVKMAIDLAEKNPSLKEEMLIYIFNYLIKENTQMEDTIKKLIRK